MSFFTIMSENEGQRLSSSAPSSKWNVSLTKFLSKQDFCNKNQERLCYLCLCLRKNEFRQGPCCWTHRNMCFSRSWEDIKKGVPWSKNNFSISFYFLEWFCYHRLKQMRSSYHMKTQLLLFQKVQKFLASVSPVTPTGDDKENGPGLWQELKLSMKNWTLFSSWGSLSGGSNYKNVGKWATINQTYLTPIWKSVFQGMEWLPYEEWLSKTGVTQLRKERANGTYCRGIENSPTNLIALRDDQQCWRV